MKYNIQDIDCRPLLDSSSIADNLLAILCRLENKQNRVVKQILAKISQLEGKTRRDYLEKLFILTGLRPLSLQNLVEQESKKVPISVDMRHTIWGEELFAQGKFEGKLEGEVALLQRQLTRRFGTLPEWAKQQIAQANSEELERWSLQVLEADSLETVLGKTC